MSILLFTVAGKAFRNPQPLLQSIILASSANIDIFAIMLKIDAFQTAKPVCLVVIIFNMLLLLTVVITGCIHHFSVQ